MYFTYDTLCTCYMSVMSHSFTISSTSWQKPDDGQLLYEESGREVPPYALFGNNANGFHNLQLN